ncbi:tellurite resistance TerB family protein [Xanthobacter sp. KR7-65]|uniref:tellurite resistance TerB family protein n=1 Tax=Xanthobacter sp. KR7-65 TaxID=3156612 RepID=UPI0032B4EDC6
MINVEHLLSQILHNGQGQEPQRVGSANGNANGFPAHAGSFLGDKSAGYAGALGAGAVAGGLASVLFGSKRMREVASTALQVGAVAAIGGLAYKAYQNYQQGRPVVPQGLRDLLPPTLSAPSSELSRDAFVPPPDQTDAVARLLLKAMIAAAAADGHLDNHERHRIRNQLQATTLTDEEKRYMDSTLSRPASIAEIVNEAMTLALRMEVYMAARLAIEPDSQAERDWLNTLATELKLDPGLRAQLDAVTSPERAEAA